MSISSFIYNVGSKLVEGSQYVALQVVLPRLNFAVRVLAKEYNKDAIVSQFVKVSVLTAGAVESLRYAKNAEPGTQKKVGYVAAFAFSVMAAYEFGTYWTRASCEVMKNDGLNMNNTYFC